MEYLGDSEPFFIDLIIFLRLALTTNMTKVETIPTID